MTAVMVDEPTKTRRRRSTVRWRDLGIVITLALLFVALSVSSPTFLAPRNLLNIAEQTAPLGIVACGMTLVFIAGGFDLSVGANFGLAGVIAAIVAVQGHVVAGLIAGIACGALLGLANGALATVGRLNALIATLATSVIVTGIALGLSDGMLISVADSAFSVLGQGRIFGIRYVVLVFALVAVVLSVAMHRTTWGRYLYATGGNPEAARLSGLRVDALRASTYVVGGACAGLAGIIVASRVATGQADAGGMTLVMDAITAVVIGGTSILGGTGAVWRTVVGLFVLALVQNGFNLLNVDIVYQRVIFGLILLIAVGVDAWTRGKR